MIRCVFSQLKMNMLTGPADPAVQQQTIGLYHPDQISFGSGIICTLTAPEHENRHRKGVL